MSYDQNLATRIREYFKDHDGIEEREMFGGLAFMIGGHMCVGANDHRLMARVGPDSYEHVLENMYATIMDITGKPLKGFVFIEPEATESDEELHKWIELCENFVNTLPPRQLLQKEEAKAPIIKEQIQKAS